MADHFIPLEGVSGNISIKIVTPDARGEYRVRLWSDRGRDPERVDEGPFDGKQEVSASLGPADGLRARTVTWSLRFVPAANPGSAEFRASIRIETERGDSLHAMQYSGPLDDETHEIAGEFHFQPR